MSEAAILPNELERALQLHTPQAVIMPAGEPIPVGVLENTSYPPISTRQETICRECWMSTHSLPVAVWPCLVRRLLERDRDMTMLVQSLWRFCPPTLQIMHEVMYRRLGLSGRR